MPLQIVMHMFSGRRDPEWTIDGAEEQELRRLIASPAFDSARPIVPYRMGYRGFSIYDLAAEQQPLLHVRSLGRSVPSHDFVGAPEVEAFLLRTGGDQLPFRPDQIVTPSPAVLEEPHIVRAAVTCLPSLAADAPPWEPDRWNANGYAYGPVRNNNCYNYATNSFATPADWGSNVPGTVGRRSAGPPISAVNNLAGARADGLQQVTNWSAVLDDDGRTLTSLPARPLGAGHYVALVMHPNVDFHWYRQDNVGGQGCWSHKLGGTPATNLDNSGQEIIDPKVCDRGSYTLFVCYMIVPFGTNVVIRG